MDFWRIIISLLLLPAYFLICNAVSYLKSKYNKWIIFSLWTAISIVVWGVCFSITTSLNNDNEFHESLNVWQMIIIGDLIIYVLFLVSLFITTRE